MGSRVLRQSTINRATPAHMPWLAKTFWQLLLSLDLFCCRHCWTALSLPSNCRQKRDASRLQACCSCGVPMWLWASEDEIPNSSMRTATTYRMTISRTAAITCWSRLQRASSATVPKLVFENRTQPATAIKRRLTLDQNSFQYDHGAF